MIAVARMIRRAISAQQEWPWIVRLSDMLLSRRYSNSDLIYTGSDELESPAVPGLNSCLSLESAFAALPLEHILLSCRVAERPE